MKIEERSDGLHISGYVNVTGKLSNPVMTPRGKVLETIEERAFASALAEHKNITVELDHDAGNVYASTSDGSLELVEDHIGLHANVLITDSLIIELARKGRLKGWSFGMYNVIDELEQRADSEYPIRHVKSLSLDHISLIANQTPCYSATSIECRGESSLEIESRSFDFPPEYVGFNVRPDISVYKMKSKSFSL